MTMNAQQRVRNIGDRVFSAAKDNPEGLLLLAAGCALLMRSNRLSSQKGRSQYRPDSMREKTGTMSAAAETARDYVSNVADKVGETAQSYAASATQAADDVRRTVTEKSGQMAEQAQATMRHNFNRVLQEQPLVLVFAGLAAGVAVAAALPSTEIEKQALGPAGEFMTDVAAKTGERLKDATVQAGEQLKADARERGLDKGGLTEMVEEAAGAFSSAVAGENKNTQAGSAPGRGSQSSDNAGRSPSDLSSRQPGASWKPDSST
jgi:hypothetical protein